VIGDRGQPDTDRELLPGSREHDFGLYPLSSWQELRSLPDARAGPSRLELPVVHTEYRAVVFAEADSAFADASPDKCRAAARVLAELRKDGVAVVIFSMNTHAEIEVIQELLGNADPCVVERGSAVVMRDGYFPDLSEEVALIGGCRTLEFGLRRDAVRTALYRAAAFEYVEIVGVSDMSAEEIAATCGLSLHQARLVSQRGYSEKFMVLDPSELTHTRLRRALRAVGLECAVDNRLWQVDGSPGFGPALTSLRQLYGDLPSAVYFSNAPDLRSWAGSLATIASGFFAAR
jgi:mannosyl-3-phosphoglycerate phosphatase